MLFPDLAGVNVARLCNILRLARDDLVAMRYFKGNGQLPSIYGLLGVLTHVAAAIATIAALEVYLTDYFIQQSIPDAKDWAYVNAMFGGWIFRGLVLSVRGRLHPPDTFICGPTVSTKFHKASDFG